MKLVKPSFEILEQEPSYEGMLRHIERCGRTCYKSEDKITKDSAKKFVDMIINRGHTAMLEHGTVYLHIRTEYTKEMLDKLTPCPLGYIAQRYLNNKYSEVNKINNYQEGLVDWSKPLIVDYYITTNYRVLLQNGWLDDLKYQCEPTEHHVKRVTVKFVCDRGVSHEFVRHRVFSFAQESTRYCNYSKDKFGKECTFIIPSWLDLEEGSYKYEGTLKSSKGERIPVIYSPTEDRAYNTLASCEGFFLQSLFDSETQYFKLLEKGWIAQQARAVLPNSLKTELIMTGTIDQWKGFFKLRNAKDAHPQARELAQPLHEEFIKKGWLV